MAYKVLDLYRDLPRTNCGRCGKGGCFAFASSVYLEGLALDGCPELSAETVERLAARLPTAGVAAQGASLFASLRRDFSALELSAVAGRTGAVYRAGPPEELELVFLGRRFRLAADAVEPVEGAASVWVRCFLLLHACRGNGSEPKGEWVAFRTLPGAANKARAFEACGARVAKAFGKSLDALDERVAALGGWPAEGAGAADRAYGFRALPKVSVLLLVWSPSDDLPADARLLVDAGLLDHLDPEGAVFLAEAFTEALLAGTAS